MACEATWEGGVTAPAPQACHVPGSLYVHHPSRVPACMHAWRRGSATPHSTAARLCMHGCVPPPLLSFLSSLSSHHWCCTLPGCTHAPGACIFVLHAVVTAQVPVWLPAAYRTACICIAFLLLNTGAFESQPRAHTSGMPAGTHGLTHAPAAGPAWPCGEAARAPAGLLHGIHLLPGPEITSSQSPLGHCTAKQLLVLTLPACLLSWMGHACMYERAGPQFDETWLQMIQHVHVSCTAPRTCVCATCLLCEHGALQKLMGVQYYGPVPPVCYFCVHHTNAFQLLIS